MRGKAMLAAIWLAVAASAHAADYPELTDAVPGHSGVTFLDLVKQVIPDLDNSAANKDIEGHLKSLKHLAGKEFDGPPPDPIVAQSFLEFRKLGIDGKPRLILLEDLGSDPDRAYDTALLALYDDAPAIPKLLFARDVGIDRDTTFAADRPLDLGRGRSALVTISEHVNSNEAYDGYLIVLALPGRFELIDQITTFNDHMCGWDRTEMPVFSTRPDPQRRYAEIVVTVTEKRTRSTSDCGDDPIPKPYTRIWRTVYRWNAGKGEYVDAAHGLDGLAKANAKRIEG